MKAFLKYAIADYLVNAGLRALELDRSYPYPPFSNKIVDIKILEAQQNAIANFIFGGHLVGITVVAVQRQTFFGRPRQTWISLPKIVRQ